jgi:hypothetical protein
MILVFYSVNVVCFVSAVILLAWEQVLIQPALWTTLRVLSVGCLALRQGKNKLVERFVDSQNCKSPPWTPAPVHKKARALVGVVVVSAMLNGDI